MSLGVLVSGNGSNLAAILAAAGRREIPEVALVLSNVPGCRALARAEAAGVPAKALDSRQAPDRAAYDAALAGALRDAGVELVCLAGFMRLIGAPMLDAFPGKILNIHPSLLPAFPGLRAQRQALTAGVRIAGCTVHFVDAGMDAGAIIAQAGVPVQLDDTEETLAARILEAEHRLFPAAIGWVARGEVALEAGRARWQTGRPPTLGALTVPTPVSA
ncbi:MAG: phosphoribosylglycinamide formyltransferase [Deltaproteobacteria bacterium]